MGLWIVGAGGVGREALDACRAGDIEVAGFLDDVRGGQVVRDLPTHSPEQPGTVGEYLIGIAAPAVRDRLSARLDSLGWTPRAVSHPKAGVAPETTIGPGLLLLANAYVSSSVTIGRHCQVHYNATVGHDTVLEDFVTIYPGANISGSVHLEPHVTVGSNAVVLQGRRVGRGAFVGAGSVVTHDVAAGAVVAGAPARPLSQ